MKNLIRLSIPLLFISILSACATAPGKEFSEISPTVPDKGNIYIYRTSAFFAMAQDFPVLVDGEKQGSLFNKSFLLLHLTPGSHTLKVAPGGLAKDSELTVQIDAGHTNFYQYDFVTGPLANFLFIGSSIKSRDKDIAVTALKELKSAQVESNK